MLAEILLGAAFGAAYKGIKKICKDNPSFSVDVDEEGIVINESGQLIEWCDIVSIDEIPDVDEKSYYTLTLRGGLMLSGRTEPDALDHYSTFPKAKKFDMGAFDCDDISPSNLKHLIQAISDLRFSVDMADCLRDTNNVFLFESKLLELSVHAAQNALVCHYNLSDRSERCAKQWAKKISASYAEAHQLTCNRILREGKPTSDDEFSLIGKAMHVVGVASLDDPTPDVNAQKNLYMAYYVARRYNYELSNETVNAVLVSDDGCAKPFGDSEWKNERKMIICPVESGKRRPNFKAIAQGKSVHNVMIMSADDVEHYNDSETGQEYPLLFAKGHPIAGNIYVQNPFKQNEYFEASSYKNNIVIRKYEELCHLLECLGATEISMSVEATKSQSKNGRTKKKVDIRGEYSAISGTVNHERDDAESSADDAYQKMSRKRLLRPVGRPHVPDDLIFYSNEPSWRRLAQSALEGRVIKEIVEVEFRENSVFSAKQCQSISAEVKSLIPGYEISVGGDYACESESERKKSKSEVWHYDVTFAPVADDSAAKTEKNVVQSSHRTPKSAGPISEGEELVQKYAIRYAHTKAAQESGLLTDAQRMDLERLAKRYKINEMRLDKIIDRAFA